MGLFFRVLRCMSRAREVKATQQREYPSSFFFLAAGCVSRLGSVWERPASSVRAVRAAAFSTRVGVQVSRWVVVTTTRDVVRSRVVRIAEDLNMGGMVGWFGVFTFFCSVR